MAEETKETNGLNDLLGGKVAHFSDKSLRRLLRRPVNVQGLVEIAAPGLARYIKFSGLERLSTSFIPRDLREREADILYRVPFQTADKTDEVIIHILIEHQSTVDETMGFRVLRYMVLIWDAEIRRWQKDKTPKSERRLSPILPILFYTGDQSWNVPLTLEALMDLPKELERFIPKFETVQLDVKETEVEVLTQTENLIGWLLTVLQKEHASTEELRRALVDMLMHIGTLPAGQEAEKREAIQYILSLIMYRRPPEEHEALIELVDRRTPTLEVDSMKRTIAHELMEQGIEIGEQRGEQRGIEIGEQRGVVRAKREAILKVLHFRFGDVPDTLTRKIGRMRSLQRLDSILTQAVEVQSIEDIEA